MIFFDAFLDSFIPPIEEKAKQVQQTSWILETTGSKDAADALSVLKSDYQKFFSDPKIYEQLLSWKKSGVDDPLLERQLNVLILRFKENMVPDKLREQIAQKESQLARKYTTFRPVFQGRPLTENQIRQVLKDEDRMDVRKKVWQHSKEVGSCLAPLIVEIVELRNKAARHLGYENYFLMQLDLQEVDMHWLFSFLKRVEVGSQDAYDSQMLFLEKNLMERFGVGQEELFPWTWSDPFCQEDPLNSKTLDSLVAHEDLVGVAKNFYTNMGLDVDPILKRSDLYERENKNQHAFCIHIDRKGDVRTLNNLVPSLRWADTLLHELGHGVYEMGMDFSLPWLLREPPHMITTEAMALLMGSQVYSKDFLKKFLSSPVDREKESAMIEAQRSRKRQQLIFSRWVMVMTYFEEALYRDPHQDLQKLWWQLVERYQKVKIPPNREHMHDWAAKFHIGLAPVYYYSYLLGEIFASSLKSFLKKEGQAVLWTSKSGQLLNEKLFFPANRYRWDELIEKVLGKPFSEEDWRKEFVEKNS
jgi:peptidyl-dipeptidase A